MELKDVRLPVQLQRAMAAEAEAAAAAALKAKNKVGHVERIHMRKLLTSGGNIT